MRYLTAKYAVARFNVLKEELAPAIELIGRQALQCCVRQRQDAVDKGWYCSEVGVDDDSESFWGVMYERRGDGHERKTLIVLDVLSVDSIEFETFDPEQEEEPENDQIAV